MNTLTEGTTDAQIEHLVCALDSLLDGELAAAMLIACGQRAVPYLEHFLLAGPLRTIALPRCRAARALGELGAHSVLTSYFSNYQLPRDPVVLFAEDGVRSTVAKELLRWKSDDVFHVLLDAAGQRATEGLIAALGEFCRTESVPLLFQTLEDDLCREEAKCALRKVSESARRYALWSIRGLTDTQLRGTTASRRLRATLQLLCEFGISPQEWSELETFLIEKDADVVIAAATLGASIGPENGRRGIVEALFRISDHLNWVQEDAVIELLDAHHELACDVARTIVDERNARGDRPNWLASSWRILRHVLDRKLERGCSGAA